MSYELIAISWNDKKKNLISGLSRLNEKIKCDFQKIIKFRNFFIKGMLESYLKSQTDLIFFKTVKFEPKQADVRL